jgi:hypothetical protein
MSARVFGLTAAAALALAACNDPGQPRAGAGGGAKLCTPFAGERTEGASAPAAHTPPPMGARAMVDDCLHRWAYALAASPDPADHVAAATVAACSSALAAWNQQALVPQAGDGRAPAEAPSLLTGEETNPVAERYGYAQGRALFYVVQSRAGKCPPPPMADGQPEGRRY